MKIVVIDGQGGKMGGLLIEQLIKADIKAEIIAIGTNSIATSVMLRNGATVGATGENPVIVNCRDADMIVGPIGIVIADSLYGEVTPKMAAAVGSSNALKILIPVSRCNVCVAGTADIPLGTSVQAAVKEIVKNIK